MDLYLFAILPFSLLWWPKERRGIVGIIPLIAALVPAAIAGARSLFNRRNAQRGMDTQQRQAQRTALTTFSNAMLARARGVLP